MHDERTEPGTITWARDCSPLLRSFATRYRETTPFDGRSIAVSAPLTPHTGLFVETLREGGASVAVTGELGSTHQDVVTELESRDGITTYAHQGMTAEELVEGQRTLLESGPDLIADDGCYLVSRVHDEFPDAATEVIGACEQTTGGVTRLRAMDDTGVLAFPVYNVNNTPMKNHFDNVHGTAESTLTSITSITNTMLAGSVAVVAGYGHCGRGLANKLNSLGARTIVTEIDPRRALEALADGHQVTSMKAAVTDADYLITTTGNYRVVRREHFESIADDVIIASAGSAIEIDVDALTSLAQDVRRPKPGLERYVLPDGRRVNLLTAGQVVNLSAPDSAGNPSDVMDMTFAMMARSLEELANGVELPPGLHPVPDRVDRAVAHEKLEAMGVDIDAVTDEQAAYLDRWERHGSLDETDET